MSPPCSSITRRAVAATFRNCGSMSGIGHFPIEALDTPFIQGKFVALFKRLLAA